MALNMALYTHSYKDPEVGGRKDSRDDTRNDLNFLRSLLRWLLFAMLATFFGGVLLMGRAMRDHMSFLTTSLSGVVFGEGGTFSGNVSTCPGMFCATPVEFRRQDRREEEGDGLPFYHAVMPASRSSLQN